MLRCAYVGIRLCGKYVMLFHVIIFFFFSEAFPLLFVKLISLCACFLLECDPNCDQCDINGPAKCDDNHCKAGYNFVGDSKNCTGS